MRELIPESHRDLLEGPVNVLLIDPKNGARFLEVRGEVVEIT